VLYVNSVVHVVMYCYYFVTSMWPQYKNNLWWKKYITQLQMVNNININSIPFNCLLPSVTTFKCSLYIVTSKSIVRQRPQNTRPTIMKYCFLSVRGNVTQQRLRSRDICFLWVRAEIFPSKQPARQWTGWVTIM
jgi:hypothetical protein